MRALALLLGFAAALAAAQAPEGSAPPAFVSRLQAQPGERCVVLTWRNPSQAGAFKLVYRSAEAIRPETLGAAELVARLDPAAERYEDTPPDGSSYFYAVLLEDASGEPVEVLLPLRNKTSQGVRAGAGPTEEQPAAEITALRAEVVGDLVRLRFSSSQPQRPLLVFRSPTPIISAADLAAAGPPATLSGAQEHLDYPVPGLDNYYAVLDAGQFQSGRSRIAAGANATLQAVQVPAEVPRAALPSALPLATGRRLLPLPQLRLPEASPQAVTSADAEALPIAAADPGPPRPLRPRTLEVLARLLPEEPDPAPGRRSVQVLASHSGSTPALEQVVRERLQTGAYAEAESALRGMLMLPGPGGDEAYLRFYLGQSLYMQELYGEAALEFVLARQSMYALVQPWLEDSLRMLRLKGSLAQP